jgi:RecG-like helicase
VWFNQLYLRDKLHPGMTIRVQGQAKRRGYGLQLVNPQFTIITEARDPAARDARIRAVYPRDRGRPHPDH